MPADWPDDGNFVESIAARFAWGHEDLLVALLVEDEGVPDPMHRNQLLAVDEAFAAHREIGVGHDDASARGVATCVKDRRDDNRPSVETR